MVRVWQRIITGFVSAVVEAGGSATSSRPCSSCSLHSCGLACCPSNLPTARRSRTLPRQQERQHLQSMARTRTSGTSETKTGQRCGLLRHLGITQQKTRAPRWRTGGDGKRHTLVSGPVTSRRLRGPTRATPGCWCRSNTSVVDESFISTSTGRSPRRETRSTWVVQAEPALHQQTRADHRHSEVQRRSPTAECECRLRQVVLGT
jgi:hypothetical protein